MIPVNAVQIIWEPSKRSLTEENMEDIAEKLRDSVKEHIACTGFTFNCSQQYICRPPDICTGSFACPGNYVPFQGGSQCPVAFGCAGTQFYGIVAPPGSFSQSEQGGAHAEIACTGFPAFTCAQRYICRPPDTCTFSFACPGRYVPSFPSGGGGCPTFFCGSFQFQQPCTFQFGQPCGPFPFQQPCTFQFGQPCGPFPFQQPCTFQFGQPCRPFPFQPPCGPFQFGGSQCGTPGGFACAGQQFFGIVGPPGSQCGTLGGFACPGVQFAGAPVKPPGMVSHEAPLPPMDFSVKADPSKDNK